MHFDAFEAFCNDALAHLDPVYKTGGDAARPEIITNPSRDIFYFHCLSISDLLFTFTKYILEILPNLAKVDQLN